MTNQESRRPVRARASNWAQVVSAKLVQSSITPNQISVASAVFAAIGALAIFQSTRPFALLICIVFIQLRLICNLLDGMVAIEGGKQSVLGSLYNEFPDRIADSVLIVALGYAAGIPVLGWLGALIAALTAYIRVFGGTLGLAQDFRGPMAKQHRMAVMTIGCLAGAVEQVYTATLWSLSIAAVLIAAGSAITCVTRTMAMVRQLKEN